MVYAERISEVGEEMSRIEDKFKELKAAGRKALITFVTAGDPDLVTTIDIVKEMQKEGTDLVELGIPYSDPIAEGPVIQEANRRALKNGIRIHDVLEAVAELRRTSEIPILFLLYFNCILQYGIARFFADCGKSGVDGVIIPDLPFEERDEIDEDAKAHSVEIISLVSPVSGERIERIAKNAKGFLYCISSLGVTGTRHDFHTDFNDFFSCISRFAEIPKAIGFGISTREQVMRLKHYCEGIIVGSGIVQEIGASSAPQEAVRNAGSYVRMLRNALDTTEYEQKPSG